jgi:hypothetical protein
MVETDGELEAIYRFLSNGEVSGASILEPHIQSTMRRGKEAKVCLVLHDTTDFEFSGDREGLGLMPTRNQGFFAHFALAALPGKKRIPVGVCGLEVATRKVLKDTARRHSYYTAQDPERESLRWLRMLESIESRREAFDCIHVMDREADIFDLMALASARQRAWRRRGPVGKDRGSWLSRGKRQLAATKASRADQASTGSSAKAARRQARRG